MNKPQLRDYQQKSENNILNYIENTPKRKKKPVVSVQPTGSGKSLVIGSVASKLNHPILVLQPSKEILLQNYEKLINFGGEASIYSASVGKKEVNQITYATLGSIKTKASLFKDIGVQTVLIDECHSKFSPNENSMFKTFMDELKPINTIGFTATPFILKQYSLGLERWSQLNLLNRIRPSFFRDFIDIIQIQEIISKGFWCKLNYEVYDFDEDLLEYNTTGSEFTDVSIKKAISNLNINNNIYLKILDKLNEGRKKIIVFLDSVENCYIMKNALGEVAEAICGVTRKKQRGEIIEKFKTGKLKVLINHTALGIGLDVPEIDCVILGRPTNSFALIYQFIGRAVRPSPVKLTADTVDYGGNIRRFGKVEDLRIEKFKGNYYGIMGDKLITGVPLDGIKPNWSEFKIKNL